MTVRETRPARPEPAPAAEGRPIAFIDRARAAVTSWWAVPAGVWLASRIALVILTFAAGWTVQSHQVGAAPSFSDLWDRWDVVLFRRAAQYGWFSPQSDPHQAVDFPGFPLVLRVVHPLIGSWVIAGIVISAVAGLATSIALHRLAAEEEPAGSSLRSSVAGRRAVLYVALFPYAVFLFAGYSEGLFLAFATTSWLAARHDRWLLAAGLAAGAAATRVTGLAFAVALVVEYLTSHRRSARAGGGSTAGPLWSLAGLRGLIDRRFPALALPAVPVVAYLAYLHHHTGRWDAYTQAMRLGWGRTFASPLDGWRTTWAAAFAQHQSTAYAWFWRGELLAVVVGVALTFVLLRQRRWGEATYVGLTLAMMSATNYYASGIRAVLVWFPLYLLMARLANGRVWLHNAFVWVMAPLMAAISIGFIGGAWID
jgi:hypothetical protein